MEVVAVAYGLIAIIAAAIDLYDDNFSKKAVVDRVFGFDNILLDVSAIFMAIIVSNLLIAVAVGITRPTHTYDGQVLYSSAGGQKTASIARSIESGREAASAEREPQVPSITPDQFRKLLSDRSFLAKVIDEHRKLHGQGVARGYYDRGETDEELLLEFLRRHREVGRSD